MRRLFAVLEQTVLIAVVSLIFSLAACADAKADRNAGGQAGQSSAALADIQVPAGRYTLDRNHSNLSFQAQHLGLSNYVMRFKQYDIELVLKPEALEQSSVRVTIDPTSVATDYHANYPETHPDAEYDSWTKTLARSDKFLNAGQHP